VIHPVEWLATDRINSEKENPYFNSTIAHAEKLVGGKRSLCRLYQKDHEILFVPRHWTHQVLNIDETTIGFAIEVDNYVY